MIDNFISAEIPDSAEDPELYVLVREHMMHGPCGIEHSNSPCMIDYKCSKHFPKKYCEQTTVDDDGYPRYRRRNNGRTIEKSKVALDNGYVVLYSKTLLKQYQAHINVEWCNQSGAVKYLFKYINKGPDRISAGIYVDNGSNGDVLDQTNVDEIKAYLDCRYVSACESAWRLLKFEIHHRTPSVERLSFHMPGQQQVVYQDASNLDDVLEKPSVGASMFTAWMEINKTDEEARELTYAEFPTKYVFKLEQRKWFKRKQRFAVGRIHYVPERIGECYYLRMLLNYVKGATGWESFKKWDNVVYKTFKEACLARGLLDNDKEYITGIKDAIAWGSAHRVRKMFVMLLYFNSLSDPVNVWEQTWEHLAEDVERKQRRIYKNPGIT